VRFAEYAERYDFVMLTRTGGILEARLHSDDGPFRWSRKAHRELPSLWSDISADQENRVLILTGTGDSYCAAVDSLGIPGGPPEPRPGFQVGGIPADLWNNSYTEGKKLLLNLLDIDIPVIAAVNGPALVHAEIPVLSDIVLAAPSAAFQDQHMSGTLAGGSGLVAGDGGHIVWPMLLGPNRGRYFLMTAQRLSAEEALSLGVVSEIVPAESLRERAWEIARTLASLSPLVTRYSRVAMTQPIKRRLVHDLGYGLALEGLAASVGLGPWDQSTPLASDY
jgi:enoyl-CoA hydratase/carnithine racemase